MKWRAALNRRLVDIRKLEVKGGRPKRVERSERERVVGRVRDARVQCLSSWPARRLEFFAFVSQKSVRAGRCVSKNDLL